MSLKTRKCHIIIYICFFKGGSAPFETPDDLFFVRGTYHPFLGKDVTLHIYSSEGEICAAQKSCRYAGVWGRSPHVKIKQKFSVSGAGRERAAMRPL